MWPSEKNVPPVQGGEAAAWRNLRLRPTRLGLGLAVMVALLWLVGLNYQANLAYAAAFWLLGFMIVGVLQNIGQLLGLRLAWQMPAEIFAGTPAVMTVQVHGARRRWLWVSTDKGQNWQPWRISSSADILELPLSAPWRGYLSVAPIELASAAPFGMCTVAAVWPVHSDKPVFPAPLAHDIPHVHQSGETDETRAMPLYGSDELSHLQARDAGAPLRHAAWKIYAKTGVLLDKRFDAHTPSGISQIISYRDYPPGTDTDLLAAYLCFRVLEAERHGVRYELALPGGQIGPQNGQREICLSALALWR